ncbi:uncharacterized protein LOC119671208 [Teleopsis dalmanni]|uniref:uncharacterized protein LOC119671208 n=1 Tax=Teleopsis dalmanni TaxID=139649 RepID=UPI0018CFC3D7|nr:uncharacterized protein LOC119671208 [Teleopsis dalmanni]
MPTDLKQTDEDSLFSLVNVSLLLVAIVLLYVFAVFFCLIKGILSKRSSRHNKELKNSLYMSFLQNPTFDNFRRRTIREEAVDIVWAAIGFVVTGAFLIALVGVSIFLINMLPSIVEFVHTSSEKGYYWSLDAYDISKETISKWWDELNAKFKEEKTD